MTKQLSIEMLPAEYGDCLWVECRDGEQVHRILIDGGPPAMVDLLRRRIHAVSPARFDLLVVSHLDADHIGGIVGLAAAKTFPASFADVWFNGYKHLPAAPARDYEQAMSLTEVLSGESGDTVLPWNIAWDGEAVVRPDDDRLNAKQPADLPLKETDWGLRITLLSPTPKRLTSLWRGWDAYLQKVRAGEPSLQPYQQRGRSLEVVSDLEELAATTSTKDNTAANGSSIAFLLEYGGKSCLFAADAFATVLYPAVSRLAAIRCVDRLEIDAFKVPHHGSQANVLPQLFEFVHSRHYLISTSGARFEHPHDVAMARIITFGGRGQTLWFNYATELTTRWSQKSLLNRYGYRVKYPDTSGGGITLTL